MVTSANMEGEPTTKLLGVAAHVHVFLLQKRLWLMFKLQKIGGSCTKCWRFMNLSNSVELITNIIYIYRANLEVAGANHCGRFGVGGLAEDPQGYM